MSRYARCQDTSSNPRSVHSNLYHSRVYKSHSATALNRRYTHLYRRALQNELYTVVPMWNRLHSLPQQLVWPLRSLTHYHCIFKRSRKCIRFRWSIRIPEGAWLCRAIFRHNAHFSGVVPNVVTNELWTGPFFNLVMSKRGPNHLKCKNPDVFIRPDK